MASPIFVSPDEVLEREANRYEGTSSAEQMRRAARLMRGQPAETPEELNRAAAAEVYQRQVARAKAEIDARKRPAEAPAEEPFNPFARAPVRAVPNQMRVPVERHTVTTRALGQADIGAQGQIQGVEQADATWQADALARESARYEREHRRLYGYDVLENEVDAAGAPVFDEAGNIRKRVVRHVPGVVDRQRAEEERYFRDRERARRDLDAMTKIANETPEPERGTWWKSATAGQRAAAVIATIFAGFGGGNAPDAMRKIADDEYKAREDTWLMRQRKAGLAREKVDDHDRMYDVMRARYDDEMTRRLMWERHTQNRFLSEFQAKMAAYGVQKLGPQQQQEMNGLLQKFADTDLALEQRLINTPAKVAVGGGYVYPREMRQIAMEEAKADIGARKELRIAVGKEQIEAPRRASEQAAKGAEETAKQASINKRWLAEQTKKARNLKGQTAAFRAKYGDDIPGLVWGIGFFPTPGSADEEAQVALELLEESTIAFLTGAHAPERTIERLTSKLRDAKAEGDVEAAMRAIEEMADIEIDTARRALDTGDLAGFESVTPENVARPLPSVADTGASDPVRWRTP